MNRHRIIDGLLATLEEDDQMNVHIVTKDGKTLGFVTGHLIYENPNVAHHAIELIKFYDANENN
jgi:hypothetical protein